MAKIALDMQSNGRKCQIAVEASMGGTNYTFRYVFHSCPAMIPARDLAGEHASRCHGIATLFCQYIRVTE
jgi:hypothetical protein